MLIGTAGVFGCLTLAIAEVRPSGTGDISSACEVIHQEVGFKAIRRRVYEALTDPKQFNKVVLLSAAVQSGMAPAGKPVEMNTEAGGAFSAFWRLHYRPKCRTGAPRENCPGLACRKLGAGSVLDCQV
jgi:hypothetical protein